MDSSWCGAYDCIAHKLICLIPWDEDITFDNVSII